MPAEVVMEDVIRRMCAEAGAEFSLVHKIVVTGESATFDSFKPGEDGRPYVVGASEGGSWIGGEDGQRVPYKPGAPEGWVAPDDWGDVARETRSIPVDAVRPLIQEACARVGVEHANVHTVTIEPRFARFTTGECETAFLIDC